MHQYIFLLAMLLSAPTAKSQMFNTSAWQERPGYFVMTYQETKGDFANTADAKCLADLTSQNWLGKQIAGPLNANRVRAFLCGLGGGGACYNLRPNSVYRFARAGDSVVGGGIFRTDASGRGPQNSATWSSATAFGTTAEYWTGRATGASNLWALNAGGDTCNGWTCDGTNFLGLACGDYYSGTAGSPGLAGGARWSQNRSCAELKRLICIVDPNY